VQAELKRLNAYPATELRQHEAEWQALDEYVARRAYVLVYGSELLPKFFSNKLNFSAAIFHPLYLTDLTSLQLK
jgi:hypothetical protein